MNNPDKVQSSDATKLGGTFTFRGTAMTVHRIGGIEKPSEGSIAEPLAVFVELKRKGIIRHIGLSNVTPTQLKEAQTITDIVCIQNFYNVAHRDDDAFIDHLARQGIAYVPFF